MAGRQDASGHRQDSEPLEAAYRVTPAEIEQAVSRTSAQYMGDLRTMLAEVGKVYGGQLAAKDAALEAEDQVISTQAETITELRRRAEQAETERDRRAAAQAAPAAPGSTDWQPLSNRVSGLLGARAAGVRWWRAGVSGRSLSGPPW